MERVEDWILITNDLIKINRKRVDSFSKASEQIKKNPILKQMLEERTLYSRQFINDLEDHLIVVKGKQYILSDTGNIFRGWMDVNEAIRPENSSTIVDHCEFDDGATLKAYDLAMRAEEGMSAELLAIIVAQKENIQLSYEQIRKLGQSLNKINM